LPSQHTAGVGGWGAFNEDGSGKRRQAKADSTHQSIYKQTNKQTNNHVPTIIMNPTTPRTTAVLLRLVAHLKQLRCRALKLMERGLGRWAVQRRRRLDQEGARGLKGAPGVARLLQQREVRPPPAVILDVQPLQQVGGQVTGVSALVTTAATSTGPALGLLHTIDPSAATATATDAVDDAAAVAAAGCRGNTVPGNVEGRIGLDGCERSRTVEYNAYIYIWMWTNTTIELDPYYTWPVSSLRATRATTLGGKSWL
jgi:hypothetical protein